jgi:hypothetical protein
VSGSIQWQPATCERCGFSGAGTYAVEPIVGWTCRYCVADERKAAES